MSPPLSDIYLLCHPIVQSKSRGSVMSQRSAIEQVRADALVFAKFRNMRLISKLVMATSRAWIKHSSKSGRAFNNEHHERTMNAV